MISEIILSYQGKSLPLTGIITPETPGRELYQRTFQALDLSPSTTTLKLLAKGKRLPDDDTTCGSMLPIFVEQHQQKQGQQQQALNKPLKLIVMATSIGVVTQLATKRSDPTIRGFEQQTQSNKINGTSRYLPWGEEYGTQDPNYKFCRFQGVAS